MGGNIYLASIVVMAIFFKLSSSFSKDPQITFRVVEEDAPGTFVGYLANVSGLSPSEENLRYSFLSLNDLRVSSLFYINSVTSVLKTAKAIDREEFCEFLVECIIKFDVQVRSVGSSYFEIIVVQVIVEDINDNSPQFPTSEITIFIRENTNIGSGYRVSGATDRDGQPNNSVQFYELLSNTADFDFNEYKKLDGSTDLEIVVMKIPDREVTSYYRFFIVASDNGDPQLSSKLIVNINITDENDNAPVFTEQDYNVTVREDTPPYTVIGRVLATDDDSAINGVVIYSFSSKRSDLFQSLFAINPTNGRLSVRNELQLHSGKQLSVVVEAKDSGSPSFTSQAKVTITIVDIGNNPPQIVISPIASNDGAVILLSEASRVGTPVVHVEVKDMDRGQNGEVECNSFHDYFSLHSLQGRGYIIQVKSALDREIVDQYNLTIICEDFGNPRLKTKLRVDIRLLDENDNNPEFSSSLYKVTMDENNELGQFIITVSASDADIGRNGDLQYFLSLPDEAMFRIDKTSGEIYANTRFDRELSFEYTLRVLAIDMGNRPLTGTCGVQITLRDLNDNRPKFKHDPLIFSVFENVPSNSTVGILQATDADSDKNGEITYYMPNSIANSSFNILPNGLIKTRLALDYERGQKIYTLCAVAEDHGVPKLSTSVTLTIYVLDANDHEPVISFSNDSKGVVIVPSDTRVGVPILKVNASDEDEGENAKLLFSLVDGNSDNIFLIRSKTGEVVLTRRITTADRETYNITVSVRDSGQIPLHTHTYFTVQIKQVNSTSILDPEKASLRQILIPVIVISLIVLLFCVLLALLLYVRKSRSFYPNSKKVHKEEYQNIKNQKYVWQRVHEHELSVPVQEMDLTHVLHGLMEERDKCCSADCDKCIDLHENKQLVTFKCHPKDLDIESSDEGSVVDDSGRGASEEDTALKIPVLDSPGSVPGKEQDICKQEILNKDFGLRHTMI